METSTLEALRDLWKVTIEGDGGHCPCCDRWGKIYRRALNAAMARSLLWLVNQEDRGDGWVHVPSSAPPWMLRSQQLPALQMWGLVEGFDSETKLASSGLWKPTPAGIAFAGNRTAVRKYVYVYNSTVLDTDGDEIQIGDALGSKYNYEEIMANYDGTDPSYVDREEE